MAVGSCGGKTPLAHLSEVRTGAHARPGGGGNFNQIAIAEQQGGEGGTA
jgi:hypothetical protein